MKKLKALTFSFDDCVTQDIRLVEILNRYGLKGTFNLNSGHFGSRDSFVTHLGRIDHSGVSAAQAPRIYEGHEAAAHTVHHPTLTELTDEEEIVREIEEDRKALEQLFGYPIVGMAYPGGGVNNDDRVADIVRRRTKIRYARSNESSGSFDFPENLLRWKATVCQEDEEDMFRLGREFLKLRPRTPKVCCIWGHSYMFDLIGWDRFEEFCRMMSGREDIFYGTNRQALLEVTEEGWE